MSSAHRPTFVPAVGGRGQGGNLASIPTTKVSARDLPSQRTLKRRKVQPTVANPLLSDIHLVPSSACSVVEDTPSLASLLKNDEVDSFPNVDRDYVPSGDESANEEEPKEEEDPGYVSHLGSDSSEDEGEELQRELEAIKRERELAAQAAAANDAARLERIKESLEETKIVRSWEDDAVFKIKVKDDRDKKPR